MSDDDDEEPKGESTDQSKQEAADSDQASAQSDEQAAEQTDDSTEQSEAQPAETEQAEQQSADSDQPAAPMKQRFRSDQASSVAGRFRASTSASLGHGFGSLGLSANAGGNLTSAP